MISPVPYVAELKAYALPEIAAPEGRELHALAQNESLRPPSRRAIEAAACALRKAHLYPDPACRAFREALAAHHGVPAARILCSAGSMELIAALAKAFTGPGRAVLAPAHAYPFFNTAAQWAQARFDVAQDAPGSRRAEALLSAVRRDTRLVFLDNPGNPTGTRLSRREILALRAGLAPDVILVIDEAYGEFADHLGEPLFDLVNDGRTVILRSLSKAYGLASLRVGWGVFPNTVAQELGKVMLPNSVSAPAQAAARAALEDQGYMRATCQETAVLRLGFIARLRAAGFDVSESLTNFALLRFETPQTAHRANRALRARGCFLRGQGGAGLPQCLRATIGNPRALSLVAETLEEFAKEEQR